MKITNLLWLLLLPIIVVLALLLFPLLPKADSAPASHIVISEVQIQGASASADFVELYNPTSSSVNLSTINLVKRSNVGSTDTTIVNFGSGDTIASHGFLLWCFNDISSNLGCDKHSADTIANNNSIALRDGALDTGTIVDAVTIGVPLHALGEGAIPATPGANQSLERKANSTSTSVTMGAGGADEFAGNSEDTDDNASDFVLRTSSQPQSKSSAIEPTPVPTPTETPIPTITLTPTTEPSATPSPSPEPTVTPTATPVPPTPTVTPTIAPSLTPTPTIVPTVTIAPTSAPTLTPSPTATITPTPVPSIFPRFSVVCTVQTKTINFGFFQIQIPLLTCQLMKV